MSVALTPIQDLHGYDKPWAGGAGKNKLNWNSWKNVTISHGTAVWEDNGVTLTATSNDCYTTYSNNGFPVDARVSVTEGEMVTLSWEESTNKAGMIYIFPNGAETGLVSANNIETKKLTYNVGSGVTYISFRFGVANSGDTIEYKNIQIEHNATPTSFEPYANICPISGRASTSVSTTDGTDTESVSITFGQTVYGGTVNFNTGAVTITDGYIASYNGEILPSTWISDRDVYTVGTTPTTGAEVVYTLATPTTLSLTPDVLTMLKGDNSITGDGVITITALTGDAGGGE